MLNPTANPLPHVIFSDATRSACGNYQYQLSRVWDESLPSACFIGLHPGINAGDIENDVIVARSARLANRAGFGGIRIVNLFARRADSSSALFSYPDPLGPDNDEAIIRGLSAAALVICAWGDDGQRLGRDKHVVAIARKICQDKLSVLGVTARSNSPVSARYIPITRKPISLDIAVA